MLSARSARAPSCPATARSAVRRSSTTCSAYLRFVQDARPRGKAAGLSPLEAARQADLGFKDMHDAERIVGNLHRAYLELDGGSAAPRSTSRALGDMVAYNGGRR